METAERIREALAQQTCTENHWAVFPHNDEFRITDGVKVMAEMCEAFWLVTAIFSWQSKKKVKFESFQVWELSFIDKENPNKAVLTCEDGNNKRLASQQIDYTDFPLPEGVKLFLDNGILLLPSEY
jgi:hypothetical protein